MVSGTYRNLSLPSVVSNPVSLNSGPSLVFTAAGTRSIARLESQANQESSCSRRRAAPRARLDRSEAIHGGSFMARELGLETASQQPQQHIRSVRSNLYSNKIGALENEIASLQSVINEAVKQPSWESLKYLRGRKAELEKVAITTNSLLEDVLSASTDHNVAASLQAQSVVEQAGLVSKLSALDQSLTNCERILAQRPPVVATQHDKSSANAFVERLPLPKFDGDRLHYPEFKQLFKELSSSLRVADIAVVEY